MERQRLRMVCNLIPSDLDASAYDRYFKPLTLHEVFIGLFRRIKATLSFEHLKPSGLGGGFESSRKDASRCFCFVASDVLHPSLSARSLARVFSVTTWRPIVSAWRSLASSLGVTHSRLEVLIFMLYIFNPHGIVTNNRLKCKRYCSGEQTCQMRY